MDTGGCWGNGQGSRQALGVAFSQRGGDKATCGGLQKEPMLGNRKPQQERRKQVYPKGEQAGGRGRVGGEDVASRVKLRRKPS